MKKQKFKINARIFLILWSVLLIGACSSDDNSIVEDPFQNESEFTMTVNGELWSANLAFCQTFYEADEQESDIEFEDDVVGVVISAYRHISDEGDIGESMTIVLTVDKKAFNNPKGIYPTNIENIDHANFSVASFYRSNGDKNYISYNINNEGDSTGEVQITGFEVGEQARIGKGYVRLSGNFSMDLYEVFSSSEELEKLEIRSGKFDVSSGFLGM